MSAGRWHKKNRPRYAGAGSRDGQSLEEKLLLRTMGSRALSALTH
jgi:hypothetical protein